MFLADQQLFVAGLGVGPSMSSTSTEGFVLTWQCSWDQYQSSSEGRRSSMEVLRVSSVRPRILFVYLADIGVLNFPVAFGKSTRGMQSAMS
jgi:hypothetical protein